MWSVDDVIVAVATPPGPGARAIVRLTGAGLAAVLARLVDIDDAADAGGAACAPRVTAARLATTGLGREWGPVPVTILHWPGPGGPVGAPLAELQLPGSRPLAAAVVAAACRHGARLARGGEFSLRAFLAGRLDLLQAEAVLGVVDARSPAELAAALDRMAGGAGARLGALRSALLDLLADVEAAIDFADESTPDAVPVADAAARRAIAAGIERLRADGARVGAELGRRDAGAGGGLPRVVLVGRPNIGKSSLFNALVGRAAALVADEAGTTRDWLEAPLAGGDAGPACVIVDLAGIVDGTADPGDAATAVARAEIARADVIVACRDAGGPPPDAAAAAGPPRIDAVTRCDRGTAAGPGIRTSVADGTGLDALRAAIRAAVAGLSARESPATARLAVGIDACLAALAAAVPAGDEALVAGHLHRALAALDEITGTAIGTDLIDRVFSRHCVGK